MIVTTEPVTRLKAAAVAYRTVLRQLLSRGRIFALSLLGIAVVVVAALIGAADSSDDPLETGVSVVADLGFTLIVPIITLVFASAALGDMRDDGTLVYLWLRPMDRLPIVVGAFAAAVTLSLPLTAVPMVATAVALDAGGALVSATLIAVVVAVLAYAALFVLFGLFTKNAIVWGIAYILIWEGLAAAIGNFAARLAVRGYTRSILTDRTGVELDLADLSQTWGIVVPLSIAVGALSLAAVRLNRLDVT